MTNVATPGAVMHGRNGVALARHVRLIRRRVRGLWSDGSNGAAIGFVKDHAVPVSSRARPSRPPPHIWRFSSRARLVFCAHSAVRRSHICTSARIHLHDSRLKIWSQRLACSRPPTLFASDCRTDGENLMVGEGSSLSAGKKRKPVKTLAMHGKRYASRLLLCIVRWRGQRATSDCSGRHECASFDCDKA